jgi:hypothetical protein
MGIRNRAVRERIAKAAARSANFDEFSRSLARIQRVVDEAIDEGLETLSTEEFSERLRKLENKDA